MADILPMSLSDAQARARALDAKRSFIVEAPAGSGKTGLLIQRLLRLLADDAVDKPEEVLAITFTRKATAEMRERLLKELRAAAQPADESSLADFQRTTRQLAQSVLVRDAEREWNLLDNPQRLNIRTIDSLCHEIAGYLPILSGLGGRLEPVNDARALYAEAARQTLQMLGTTDDTSLAEALRTLLLHRDGRLGECERLLAAMLAKRDQWARLIPSTSEMTDEYLDGLLRPRIEAEFATITATALQQVNDLISAEDLRELAALAHAAARVLAADGKEDLLGPCLENPGSPATDAASADHWRALSRLLLTGGKWRIAIDKRIGFLPGTPEKRRLLALLATFNTNDALAEALASLSSLPPHRYTEDEWQMTRSLFRLLRQAHAQLRIVFAAQGQCDFSELSAAAVDALATPSGSADLASALGLRFRHLLVDEMQDTSSSQYKLLELFTQGWDGASQTVFLVGDPRQSIYLFREACVERFFKAIFSEKLGDIPLEHLQLTTNFRSHPLLVQAFNEHFALIRPHQVHADDDSPHTPAEPGRKDVTTHPAIGLHWHADTLPNGASLDERAEASQQEAAEILRIVSAEMEHRTPGTGARAPIAVLVRTKKHAARIAQALHKAAIPYRATEIDALDGQQEVLDALSLLRALLHPGDRIAWLAVLHAPWCGLGVRDLHILAGGDDTNLSKRCIDDLLSERSALLSPEGRQRALHTQQILHAAATQQGRLPIAQWLEAAWNSLGAPLYLNADERRNVATFFTLVSDCEERGETIDAALLLERLKDLCAPESQSPAMVEIMTIHKAKGLEWDVVLVPALDRQGGTDSQPLLQYVEDVMQPAKPTLFAPIPRSGVVGESLHKYLGSLRLQAQRLELRRLFYVAATRAKQSLHLFAQPVAGKNGIAPHANSLLRAAWPAAEPHFTAPAAMPALAIAAAVQPPRIVRRIPDIAAAHTRQNPAPLPTGDKAVSPQRSYQRAEGSLSARALGTVVHAYLDRLTQEFATGSIIDEKTLSSWLPGITAMLRALGLAPADVNSRATQALSALRSALADPHGLWLLSPHPQAASELAISTWTGDTLTTYRMDRTFRAGDAPLTSGEDCLWIIDYKISAHGNDADEAFFAIESEKHRSQLETYARTHANAQQGVPAQSIRLAAFYPLRSSGEKLKVWTYEPKP
jgi:ATP-dependent exoDNAse (exonuclease V) beta subunit